MRSLLRWLTPTPLRLPTPASEVAPAPRVPPAPGLRPEASLASRLDVTQRGAEADRLLNNAVLRQALADIEQEVHLAWADTKTDERERREEYYYKIRACQAVRAKLLAYKNSGRIKAEQDKAEQDAA